VADTGFKRFFETARAVVEKLRADDGETADRRMIDEKRRYWDDSAGLTIADLAREGQTKASGRVQLISLADFRASIGDLWEQYKDRILLIAETTIARMIGRGHTFIPMRNPQDASGEADTWLLFLPGLDKEEARDLAEAIALKLGEKLVGARFTPHDPPLPHSATLDLTGVVSADGTLNMDALKSAVSRARQAQSAVIGKPEPTFAAQPAPRPRASAALRPAWNAATATEESFFLRPAAATGEELVLDTGAPFPESVAANLCTAAAKILGDINKKGLRAKLTLPVPYALLYTPAAGELRAAVSAMPKHLRLLHLRLEIVRTPSQASADQLAILRELFRPEVREVAFLIDPFTKPSDIFALDHIAIGADLTGARGWDETDLRTAVTDLRTGAANRPTYLLGLRNRFHAAMAIKGGIDEVGGASISGDIDDVPNPLRVIPESALITP
jgi:hypothetical protein